MSQKYPEFPVLEPQLMEHPTPDPYQIADRIIHLLVSMPEAEGHDLSLVFKQVGQRDYLSDRSEALLDKADNQLLN